MKTGNRRDERRKRVGTHVPGNREVRMAENRQETAQAAQGPPVASKAAQVTSVPLLRFPPRHPANLGNVKKMKLGMLRLYFLNLKISASRVVISAELHVVGNGVLAVSQRSKLHASPSSVQFSFVYIVSTPYNFYQKKP